MSFDSDTSPLLPGAKTACVRRTGIRAKRNTPKKAWKFKHLWPPFGSCPVAAAGTRTCGRLMIDVASALPRGK
jgi:hypothetical protein